MLRASSSAWRDTSQTHRRRRGLVWLVRVPAVFVVPSTPVRDVKSVTSHLISRISVVHTVIQHATLAVQHRKMTVMLATSVTTSSVDRAVVRAHRDTVQSKGYVWHARTLTARFAA